MEKTNRAPASKNLSVGYKEWSKSMQFDFKHLKWEMNTGPAKEEKDIGRLPNSCSRKALWEGELGLIPK